MIDPHRFAPWVSAEAKEAFARPEPAPPSGATIADLRTHYDGFNQRMLDKALAAYPVAISSEHYAGVALHRVTPAGGATDGRRLICLHGGAFMWGAGAGALLEAAPLAATLGCEVVAVEYRLAPEHTYPAAVDDALAVYRASLDARDGTKIGIYGCSAGGMLTAQVAAALIANGEVLPGAIAMLHGTGLPFAGDLALTAPLFDPRGAAAETPTADALPYFATADLADPLVLPGEHPSILAQFPPSLLVSGTRDFAASACATMHRRLLAAGADAQFVLFDGVGHAHHMDVTLPEARETFTLMARFFAGHLR